MAMRAGFARKDTSVWEPDMLMMGWVHPDNRAKGVGTPLHARAMVVRADKASAGAMAMVCLDTWGATDALRSAVLHRLKEDHAQRGLGPHNVLFTATHTHSGPSGFSQYMVYNACNYGYSPHVFRGLVERVVGVIVEADERCEPATLRVGTTEIPFDEPVAFNRSVDAHNSNDDVEPVDPMTPERATERRTVTLSATDSDGRVFGLVNWFAVHGTSIHSDNTLLHPDNKGLAALMVEERAGKDDLRNDVIAIFTQEASGDVSPNMRWDKKRRRTVGPCENDLASAEFSASLQMKYALEAMRSPGRLLEGDVGGIASHVDFTCAPVSVEFARGLLGIRTTTGSLGLSMIAGTDEGAGPLRRLMPVLRGLAKARGTLNRWRKHPVDVKAKFIGLTHRYSDKLFGVLPSRYGLKVAARIDPMVRFWVAADPHGEAPWSPSVLVMQLLRIGSFAIAAVPFEPTTQVGRRVRSLVVQKAGAEIAVMSGYSNGYCSYVTTFEEYQHQEYEGGSTHFGPWTLGAVRTELAKLAEQGISSDPLAPVDGPPLPEIDEAMLVAQRRLGRKVMKGPGTDSAVPSWPPAPGGDS